MISLTEPESALIRSLTKLEFALCFSESLLDTLQSFHGESTSVIGLIDELIAFAEGLKSLHKLNDGANLLAMLDPPLSQCGDACKGLENSIRCAAGSDTGTGSTDWSHLRYLGDNIDEFAKMLAIYKFIFNIVIGDADRNTISNTTAYLKTRLKKRGGNLPDHSRRLEETAGHDKILEHLNLGTLDTQSVLRSSEYTQEEGQIESEVYCILLCILICTAALENPQLAGLELMEKILDVVTSESIMRSTLKKG